MMEIGKQTNVIFILLIAFSIVFTMNAITTVFSIYVISDLLKAFLLIFLIYIYGYFVLCLFKNEKIDVFDALGVGLIITTFIFFLAAFFKILYPWIFAIFYLSPIILLYFILRKQRDSFGKTIIQFFRRPLVEYLIFLFPFIYAALPSSFYDTLVYHLGLPNLYLQHHGFIQTPQLLYANTSIYAEVTFIPAVFAGEMVPRFVHFFCAIILILSGIDFACKNLGLRKRLPLLLILVSMPVSMFLITTVKNDLFSAFFILLGIKFYLRGKYTYSAMFWGFSLGIKYFNIIPLGIFFIMIFIKEKSMDKKRIVLIGLIILVMLLPLFLKNIMFTGNPVFPFFGQYFTSQSWDSSRYEMMKRDVGKIFHSFLDVLKFPYTLSFKTFGFVGNVGAQFLIFLPLLILKPPKSIFLLLFSVFTLFISANFTGSTRFFFIVFIFLSMYVALVVEMWQKRIIKILFYIIISVNFISSLTFQESIFRSHILLSGKLDIESYKAYTFPSYSAISFLNQTVKKKATILLVGESRNYYLKRPYHVASAIDYSILKKYLENSENSKAFISQLQKDNIHYILYNPKEFDRLQVKYQRLPTKELIKLRSFIQDLKIIFHKADTWIYQID